VQIDSQPLNTESLLAWRGSVGYVPQENFLFHDTVRKNLVWARPGAAEKDLWYALRLAAADQFVKNLPEGMDTVVGDRGGRLSGGERQRIALARALLIKPVFLLLDEATSHVDKESEKQILNAVFNLRGETTVVIIAHHAERVLDADQVIRLEKGVIVPVAV
jgi:ATP-binding cassette subfamily C protein